MGMLTADEIEIAHDLTGDALATVLSNVTMAAQGAGRVDDPEDGGWYVRLESPPRYVVNPGFAAAWLRLL